MNDTAPVEDAAACVNLRMLEDRLHTSEPDAVLLRRYYDYACKSHQFEQAKCGLAALQQCHPGNHDIRRLYIAVCLQLDESQAAMDAIETLVAFSNPDDALLDSALSVRDRIGPRKIRSGEGPWASLSLCMVVKNEISRLGPCLNAAKHIADEIVVVDTGSNDRTADMARVYGAHVYPYAWRDDFSAARNFSLDNARGEWILVLDADEIIAAADQPLLRRYIERHNKSPRAFSIETRNYTNSANALNWKANNGQYLKYEAGLGWFPSRKIRLFPRADEIRFCFPVHELVDPAIRAAGLTVQDCEVPVHHYGHLDETRNKHKALAYFKIGYAKLEQLGNDFGALRELAVQAGQLEKWSQALDLWRRLILLEPQCTEAYVNMAGACWQKGDYHQAADHARQALERDPDMKEAHLNLAISQLMLGNADAAEAILSPLLARHTEYLAARFMLGVACCALENQSRCRTIFRSLVQSPAGPALSMALKDIIQRFQNAGLERYAAMLKQTAQASVPDNDFQLIGGEYKD